MSYDERSGMVVNLAGFRAAEAARAAQLGAPPAMFAMGNGVLAVRVSSRRCFCGVQHALMCAQLKSWYGLF